MTSPRNKTTATNPSAVVQNSTTYLEAGFEGTAPFPVVVHVDAHRFSPRGGPVARLGEAARVGHAVRGARQRVGDGPVVSHVDRCAGRIGRGPSQVRVPARGGCGRVAVLWVGVGRAMTTGPEEGVFVGRVEVAVAGRERTVTRPSQ